MRLRYLFDFFLVSSYCSGLSVTSSNAQVPEPPFNRTCCSNTSSVGVSHTRFLRASGGVVPNEIEGTADGFLAQIAASHFDSQQKRRKESESAIYGRGLPQERLVKTTKELFRQPEFKRWIEHVNDLKGKNPEQEISAIPTLTAHFGDEELYKILDVATKIPKYENLAKNLQAEQRQHWLQTNKDPEKVFDMFGLWKKGNIFLNPKFLDYVTYADELIAKNPEIQTSMITTILKHHDAAILIKQIHMWKAYRDGEIKDVAIRLERDLITHLVQTRPLGEALNLLQIGPLPPVFRFFPYSMKKNICMQLLEGYITKRTDLNLAPISELIEIFGEDVVVLWIFTANVEFEVGGKMESVLRAYWLSKDRSLQDIATLILRVSHKNLENSDLFRSRSRQAWFSYVDHLVEKRPDTAKTFFTYVGTNILPKFWPGVIHAAERYPSLRQAIDEPPETMFLALGLGENVEKVINHPLFPLWLAYADSFSKRHPDYKGNSLVALLYHHFGRDNFPRLLKELFEFLENKKVSPALKRMLGIGKANIRSVLQSNRKPWQKYREVEDK